MPNDRGIPVHDCYTMSVVLVALVAIISFADLLAELVLSVTLDVLDRIGNDPHARFAFFKRFVEPAQEAEATVPCQAAASAFPALSMGDD